MKIRRVIIPICILALWCCDAAAQNAETARIKIDIERQIGLIDPLLYGNFIEHLGRCIYGGVYEPGSPLSDANGFRKDVVKATQELNTSIVRWPGGNFVSGYHWEDGIGPVSERPTRIDLAWGFRENNSFGTDEFVDWCHTVGTEPYFCVNLGTGSLDEARNWVEYCNVEGGTYWSDLRRSNGHEKPHNVKYWSLGNEMDGSWQMGHKNAEDYGKYALEAAKLMKWIDPGIKLVAAGSSDYGGDWIEWNRTVLDYCRNHVDYIALHHYSNKPNNSNSYYDFMAAPAFAEKAIEITEGLIRQTLSKTPNRRTPIYIAFDEWNVWYRARGEEGNEEIYNMEDALVVGSYLNAFIRNAHIVKMANMAQLVNVIAPVFTSTEGLFYQTIFYPLQLVSTNCTGTALDTWVDCGKFPSRHGEQPFLDVSSTYDEGKGEIVVSVVNRHRDSVIRADILCQSGSFDGTASINEVNAKELTAENSPAAQNVKTVTTTRKASGEKFTHTFPAHSYTLIRIPVKL
jgi:alpha-N-arabinofuranosidase